MSVNIRFSQQQPVFAAKNPSAARQPVRFGNGNNSGLVIAGKGENPTDTDTQLMIKRLYGALKGLMMEPEQFNALTGTQVLAPERMRNIATLITGLKDVVVLAQNQGVTLENPPTALDDIFNKLKK